MQKKSRKLFWERGRLVWGALCGVSLYALVLRLVWHTSYLEPAVVGPLIGFAVVYIDSLKKKQNERQP